MFAIQADGAEVSTVEGLAESDGRLGPIQEAFRDQHGLQCGFCTPGILMSFAALQAASPDAGRAEVEDVLAGHLCRCTGYRNIVRAAGQVFGFGDADPETARAAAGPRISWFDDDEREPPADDAAVAGSGIAPGEGA
jgi:carbon-monoxide dehydrogenase small subunit